MATPSEACTHRWRVEEAPSGGLFPATCRSCGASTTFPAEPLVGSWAIRPPRDPWYWLRHHFEWSDGIAC